MGYKVCLKDKSLVLLFVDKISNNVMINNYVSDLVNRDGVTNFFCNNDGSYSFTLITEKKERVYILFRSDNIFISNNIDGVHQQLFFQRSVNGVSIRNNLCSKIILPNYIENRFVERVTEYDDTGNLIYRRKVTSSYLSSSDSDIGEKLKDIMYENYDVVCTDYLVDDKLVRVQSTNYLYDSSLNKNDYFVSDYSIGMIGSGDFSKYENPTYMKISEQEFNDDYSSRINDFDVYRTKKLQRSL